MARQELARSVRACAALAAMAVLLVPASADARYAKRTLTTGSQGSDVKLFQKYLTQAGLPHPADGALRQRHGATASRFERAAAGRDGRATRPDQRLVRQAPAADATEAGGHRREHLQHAARRTRRTRRRSRPTAAPPSRPRAPRRRSRTRSRRPTDHQQAVQVRRRPRQLRGLGLRLLRRRELRAARRRACSAARSTRPAS